MSNFGGEADASGAGRMQVGTGFKVDIPGLEQTTRQIGQLNSSLKTFQDVMKSIQSQAAGFTSAMTNINKAIGGTAAATGATGGSGGGLAGSAFGQSISQGGFMRDVLMFPTRFINDQLSSNRNLAMATSSMMGMQSFGSNVNTQKIMGALSGQFGGVMGGSPADILALMGIGNKVGAGIDWRAYTNGAVNSAGVTGQRNGPRAAGFLEAVRQGQIMNPGADVSQIAGSIGGFISNVGAQQQGTFMTGGAFSMVGAGNKAKSISEWSEGILKWFMNQRPGAKRGKPFDYGELMAQNFPGSNMDAWFTANGVPPDMRDYWWSYALGKASQTGTTGGASILQQGQAAPAAVQQGVAYQRLAAGNAVSRTGFSLGGKLSGMYANMEQSNRWFNELMGQMTSQVLPSTLASGTLSWMQYVPDQIRELLMQFAERTTVGGLGAGFLGWGSALGNQMAEMDLEGLGGIAGKLGIDIGALTGHKGDVGDVGDYGSNGTSGMAGMHPDMRKRMSAMMRANPNLRITSGHRDLAKQQALKRKGGNRVSGRPSAHTRGMAADMGPRSEYGWLMANAGKFGLKSGKRAGEPWHVDMGDVGDGEAQGLGSLLGGGALGLLQTIMGAFGGILGGGADPTATMTGVASGTAGLLKMLLSVFATADDPIRAGNIQFRDVYGGMLNATNQYFRTGGTGLPAIYPKTTKEGEGGSPVTGPVKGSFTGPMGSLQRAIATAEVARNAGFSGEDLFKIVAISGRESGGWNPGAVNPNSSDRGLFQMNWSAHKSWLQSTGIAPTQEALYMGPNAATTSAAAAWELFHTRGHDSWRPWKAANGVWDPNGDELYGTTRYQANARAAVAELGDVEDMSAGPAGTGLNMKKTTVFNNTFQINGQGANGGIDVRRTAQLLSDELETQMRQRMARSN